MPPDQDRNIRRRNKPVSEQRPDAERKSTGRENLGLLMSIVPGLPTGDLEVLQIALRNALGKDAHCQTPALGLDSLDRRPWSVSEADLARDLKKSVFGRERAVNAGNADANAGDEASRSSKQQASLNPELLAHAVETFGSAAAARVWLSSECGALNNRTPLKAIQSDGDEAEVERVLDCIDYGMLA